MTRPTYSLEGNKLTNPSKINWKLENSYWKVKSQKF